LAMPLPINLKLVQPSRVTRSVGSLVARTEPAALLYANHLWVFGGNESRTVSSHCANASQVCAMVVVCVAKNV